MRQCARCRGYTLALDEAGLCVNASRCERIFQVSESLERVIASSRVVSPTKAAEQSDDDGTTSTTTQYQPLLSRNESAPHGPPYLLT